MSNFITATDRVYEELKSKIIYSDLKPGDRLVHRKLAEEFGTSNTPVIEAIRRLEHDALVITHAGLGTMVKTWTRDDIVGAFTLREVLECAACRIFAKKAYHIQHATLREYGKLFNIKTRSEDRKGLIEADINLHMYIVKCSNSHTLCNFAEKSMVIDATIRGCAVNLDDIPIKMSEMEGAHDELIEALIRGDSTGAENEIVKMVKDSSDRILSVIDKNS